jgi:DNA primase
MTPALQARVARVRAEVAIADIVGQARVTLHGLGEKPRGQCPFHGSESRSFMVDKGSGFARCFGCGWRGDVIKFKMDHDGLPFGEALEALERGNGIAAEGGPAVRTQKRAVRRPDRPFIDSATLGRWIWARASAHPEAVRTYLRARGVPAAVLTTERLDDLRFHAMAPLYGWPEGQDGPAPDAPKAPAMCALIREPQLGDDGVVRFVPIGLHVTFLSPSLTAKMVRHRPDGEAYEARKALGRSGGGCILLGARCAPDGEKWVRIDHDRALFSGEGIETVFSGMAIAGAGADAIGLATISLDNLQGDPLRWRGGVWPLFDIKPDPRGRKAVCWPHRGAVTGLIDADMRPLRGPIDRKTGVPMGELVVERRGGPIVRRPIGTAERAAICASLFVQSWRAAGCRRVTAARPHMGQDFNDAVREGQ